MKVIFNKKLNTIIFLLTLFVSVTPEKWQEKSSLEENMPSDSHKSIQIVKSSAYLKASLPIRLLECLQGTGMLRCTKLFLLQQMEKSKPFQNTGNLTKDFMEQFFSETDHLNSLVADKYKQLTDKQINKRLIIKFQRFFKNRELKINFIPGVTLRVVPSKSNKLIFSLKDQKQGGQEFIGRAESSSGNDENDKTKDVDPQGSFKGENMADRVGGLNKIKNKKTSYKTTIIQMAVPILIMPAILLGSFIPFILPALKMATILSMIMNNSAFMAALMYAARTHLNSQDEQHITYSSYSHGPGAGYH